MTKKCYRCEGDGKAHGCDRPFEWTPEIGYPGLCLVCKGSGIETFVEEKDAYSKN